MSLWGCQRWLWPLNIEGHGLQRQKNEQCAAPASSKDSGYFDKAEISHSFNGGFTKSYDFEAPLPDEDEDGVPDDVDFCPGTVLPESVPTVRLLPNHFAMTTTGPDFTTNAPGQGARESFTIDETRGCSCEQIIDHLGLPDAHRRNGCPIGIMRSFIQSLP